jgi:hypothetical protein
MNGGDSAKTINSPKIVGSMSLLSPVEMMTEFVPCLHPGQIAAREYVYSWPVPVQGTMLTFNDRVVPGSVHRNLALLAALLSVVFEVPWIVRQQPFAFLGDISPLIAASRENVPSHQNGPEHPQETELPTWVFEGWERRIDSRGSSATYGSPPLVCVGRVHGRLSSTRIANREEREQTTRSCIKTNTV